VCVKWVGRENAHGIVLSTNGGSCECVMVASSVVVAGQPAYS
jgi:hypothetical protein